MVDYSIFAGAYSAAMDFALSAIPLIVLYPLRIDRKEKVGVCVAMSLGILAGIAAAVKTYHLPLISRSGDVTCKFPLPLYIRYTRCVQADNGIQIKAQPFSCGPVPSPQSPSSRLRFRISDLFLRL